MITGTNSISGQLQGDLSGAGEPEQGALQYVDQSLDFDNQGQLQHRKLWPGTRAQTHHQLMN